MPALICKAIALLQDRVTIALHQDVPPKVLRWREAGDIGVCPAFQIIGLSVEKAAGEEQTTNEQFLHAPILAGRKCVA
jgi:hypothetical protein